MARHYAALRGRCGDRCAGVAGGTTSASTACWSARWSCSIGAMPYGGGGRALSDHVARASRDCAACDAGRGEVMGALRCSNGYWRGDENQVTRILRRRDVVGTCLFDNCFKPSQLPVAQSCRRAAAQSIPWCRRRTRSPYLTSLGVVRQFP